MAQNYGKNLMFVNRWRLHILGHFICNVHVLFWKFLFLFSFLIGKAFWFLISSKFKKIENNWMYLSLTEKKSNFKCLKTSKFINYTKVFKRSLFWTKFWTLLVISLSKNLWRFTGGFFLALPLEVLGPILSGKNGITFKLKDRFYIMWWR